MNINISTMPSLPRSRKFTAHGYIKITSTSNNTNSIATRKYLIDIGVRALPITSIPDSNGVSLSFVTRLGPILCVTNMVPNNKPQGYQHLYNMMGK
jgi:hypothetical protein